MFPRWGEVWAISSTKNATAGTTQAAVKRLGGFLGTSVGLKLHIHRSWAASCANQLLYSREDREKLGRWAPGSLMPDLYDRLICTTALRLRDRILEKFRNGRAPSQAFETPRGGSIVEKVAGPSASNSISETSSLSSEVDIADLDDTKRVIDRGDPKGYV